MRTLAAIFCLATLSPAAGEPVTMTDILRTRTSWDGATLRHPGFDQPEVKAVIMEVAPGASTGWHKHPASLFAYVLEGVFRLEREDRSHRDLHAGEAYAQVVDTWHRGTNVGRSNVRVLTFILGEAGVPDTISLLPSKL